MFLRNINFSTPDISDKEISYVTQVLKSGWITTGPKVKEFEGKISDFCRTNFAKCLNSATSCLELTLRILGITSGDEVITTAYTYTATCAVICHVGATPILLDINETTFEINYDKLADAITEKTKAIILVDIGGVVCDYEKVFEVIDNKKKIFNPKSFYQEVKNKIFLISDAAHSFGSVRNGMISGSIADFTVFSFHAVKHLTCAEGGAVTWNTIPGIDDKKIYKEFSLMSLHGQSLSAFEKSKIGHWEYDILIPGFKCNMTDIHAAIGVAQLERFSDLLEKRKRNHKIYNEIFKDLDLRILHNINNIDESSNHLYIVNLLNRTEEFRNNLIEKMSENKIGTNVHYKPLPMFSAYKNIGFDIIDFPNSFNTYKNVVTLPSHSLMGEEDVYFVANTFKKILKS